MSTPSSLLAAVSIPDDVKGHIISNTRSDVQKQRVWIVCEAEYDMKLYRRFFSGKVTVYPANIKNDDGKTVHNCHTVHKIVTDIIQGGHTDRIFGIRDRDYTDFASHKYPETIPQQVFRTDERDLEMMLYNSDVVKTALYSMRTDMHQKITNCEPLLRYIACIRIWHYRNRHTVRLKKFTAKCLCDDNTKQLKTDWKDTIVNKYNEVMGEPDLLKIDKLDIYCQTERLRTADFTSICRGHDFTDLVGKYTVMDKNNISATLSSAYTLDDFKGTLLSMDIESLIQPWGISIDQSPVFQ